MPLVSICPIKVAKRRAPPLSEVEKTLTQPRVYRKGQPHLPSHVDTWALLRQRSLAISIYRSLFNYLPEMRTLGRIASPTVTTVTATVGPQLDAHLF